MDETDLQAWTGRSETLRDAISPFAVRALGATLDRVEEHDARLGAELSPLLLWLHFLPVSPMAEAGPDGHPKRGGFLPPVPLERRMWAGGRLEFHAPLRVGEEVERVSTIAKIAEKEGKAGRMVFVTARHEYHAGGRLAVTEEQDIVYLRIPDAFSPPPAQPLPACDWREEVPMSPVLLFRFSALTFNGHRIHYDLTYATETEKYPGLVVHGPLQAILLFEAARRRRPGRRPARFAFRAQRPLFDFETLRLAGRPGAEGGLELFTANGKDEIGMTATYADGES